MSVDLITPGKICFGGGKKKTKKVIKKSTNNKKPKIKSTAKRSKSKRSKSKKSKSKSKKSKSKSKRSTSKRKIRKTQKRKKRRTILGNNSREMQRQLRELHAIEKEILDRRNMEEKIYKEQMQENLKQEQRLRLQMRKPTPYIKAPSPKKLPHLKKTFIPQNITLSIKEREPNINEKDILNIEVQEKLPPLYQPPKYENDPYENDPYEMDPYEKEFQQADFIIENPEVLSYEGDLSERK